jgi:hypothetical protein
MFEGYEKAQKGASGNQIPKTGNIPSVEWAGGSCHN